MSADMKNPTNGIYNALLSSLGLRKDSFQMIQGVLPLSPEDREEIYNNFDATPPESIAVLYNGSSMINFSGTYGAILDKTDRAHKDSFLYTTAFRAFNDPRNWVNNSPPFDPKYFPKVDSLWRTLQRGSRAIIEFDSEKSDTNIDDTWAKKNNSSGVGFWGTKSSSVSKELNERAAKNRITVNIEFDKYAYLPVRAGHWYYSGFFTDMYQNASQFEGGEKTWESFFGKNGSLQRFNNHVLVVAGYKISVTSHAKYSKEDFKKIQNSTETNIWPFYVSSSSSGNTSHYKHDDKGNITVEITSRNTDMQVFGMGVIPTETAITGGSDNFNLVAPCRLI